MSDTTDSFGRDFRWWAMEAAKQEARAEKAETEVKNLPLDYATVREAWKRAEAKLAEVHAARGKAEVRAMNAEAKLAEVEKELTVICEFTQEHGDWSELPAGKAAAQVHNIARAALEGKP